MAVIRVLIVEDHPMVAAGFGALLRQIDDFEVVGVIGTIAELFDVLEAATPDVVCLDQHLPDGRGTDAAARIRATHPSTRVIMVTGADDDALLAEAISAGCGGFVTKGSSSAETLIDSIRLVARGEIALTADQLARLLPKHRSAEPAVGDNLTERELDVLRLLAAGTTTDDIAASLNISYATVRNHIQRVLTKLDAHSRLEAVAIALRLGLIDPPG